MYSLYHTIIEHGQTRRLRVTANEQNEVLTAPRPGTEQFYEIVSGDMQLCTVRVVGQPRPRGNGLHFMCPPNTKAFCYKGLDLSFNFELLTRDPGETPPVPPSHMNALPAAMQTAPSSSVSSTVLAVGPLALLATASALETIAASDDRHQSLLTRALRAGRAFICRGLAVSAAAEAANFLDEFIYEGPITNQVLSLYGLIGVLLGAEDLKSSTSSFHPTFLLDKVSFVCYCQKLYKPYLKQGLLSDREIRILVKLFPLVSNPSYANKKFTRSCVQAAQSAIGTALTFTVYEATPRSTPVNSPNPVVRSYMRGCVPLISFCRRVALLSHNSDVDVQGTDCCFEMDPLECEFILMHRARELAYRETKIRDKRKFECSSRTDGRQTERRAPTRVPKADPSKPLLPSRTPTGAPFFAPNPALSTDFVSSFVGRQLTAEYDKRKKELDAVDHAQVVSDREKEIESRLDEIDLFGVGVTPESIGAAQVRLDEREAYVLGLAGKPIEEQLQLITSTFYEGRSGGVGYAKKLLYKLAKTARSANLRSELSRLFSQQGSSASQPLARQFAKKLFDKINTGFGSVQQTSFSRYALCAKMIDNSKTLGDKPNFLRATAVHNVSPIIQWKRNADGVAEKLPKPKKVTHIKKLSIGGPDPEFVEGWEKFSSFQDPASVNFTLLSMKAMQNNFVGIGDIAAQMIRLNTVQEMVVYRQEHYDDHLQIRAAATAVSYWQEWCMYGPPAHSNIFDYLFPNNEMIPLDQWREAIDGKDEGVYVYKSIEPESSAGPAFDTLKKGEVMSLAEGQCLDMWRIHSKATDKPLQEVLDKYPQAQMVYLKPKIEVNPYRTPIPENYSMDGLQEWLDGNSPLAKARTIYAGNVSANMGVQMIKSMLNNHCCDVFSEYARASDKSITQLYKGWMNLQKFASGKGNLDLMMSRVQCAGEFASCADFTMAGYSDNIQASGKLAKQMLVPESVKLHGFVTGGSRLLPRNTRVWVTVDGKRMESSCSRSDAAAVIAAFIQMFDCNFRVANFMFDMLMTVSTGAIGVFGQTYLRTDYNQSGSPMTFDFNNFKTYQVMMDYKSKNLGDTLDLEALVEIATHYGVCITLESISVLPELGKPIIRPGDVLDLDFLGWSAYMPEDKDMFRDPKTMRRYVVPVLEHKRMSIQMAFSKSQNKDFSPAQLFAQKSISVLIQGGIFIPNVCDMCLHSLITHRDVLQAMSEDVDDDDVDVTVVLKGLSHILGMLGDTSDPKVMAISKIAIRATMFEMFKNINVPSQIMPTPPISRGPLVNPLLNLNVMQSRALQVRPNGPSQDLVASWGVYAMSIGGIDTPYKLVNTHPVFSDKAGIVVNTPELPSNTVDEFVALNKVRNRDMAETALKQAIRERPWLLKDWHLKLGAAADTRRIQQDAERELVTQNRSERKKIKAEAKHNTERDGEPTPQRIAKTANDNTPDEFKFEGVKLIKQDYNERLSQDDLVDIAYGAALAEIYSRLDINEPMTALIVATISEMTPKYLDSLPQELRVSMPETVPEAPSGVQRPDLMRALLSVPPTIFFTTQNRVVTETPAIRTAFEDLAMSSSDKNKKTFFVSVGKVIFLSIIKALLEGGQGSYPVILGDDTVRCLATPLSTNRGSALIYWRRYLVTLSTGVGGVVRRVESNRTADMVGNARANADRPSVHRKTKGKGVGLDGQSSESAIAQSRVTIRQIRSRDFRGAQQVVDRTARVGEDVARQKSRDIRGEREDKVGRLRPSDNSSKTK